MKPQTAQFLKTFNLKYPLIQAPMAGASTIELAATVTNLGGLGSIPLGAFCFQPGTIISQYGKFHDLITNDKKSKVVNLNFFAHEKPERDAIKEKIWIETIGKLYGYENFDTYVNTDGLKEPYPTFRSIASVNDPTINALKTIKPSIISFHFGLPSNQTILRELKSAGIKIFVSVTNLSEFKQIVDSGLIDGVILQGYEAGGHRGNFIQNDPNDDNLSVRELTKQVVEYIDSKQIDMKIDPPFILAAGGFYDSLQIKTFIEEFGIAGVQLGSVFLPSTQATISKRQLEYFMNPTDGVNNVMNPAISGRNLRTIETPFLKKLNKLQVERIPDYPLPYDLFKRLSAGLKQLPSATAKDNNNLDPFEFSAFLAGANFDKSYKGTRNTEDIFKDLVKSLPTYID